MVDHICVDWLHISCQLRGHQMFKAGNKMSRGPQDLSGKPPRVRSTWTGHLGEATTNTPWHTRYTKQTYQQRRKTHNKPKPNHLDRHPNNGRCTGSWPMLAP